MDEFTVAKVVIYKNGTIVSGHIPFKTIKSGNKEFWERVLMSLKGLIEEIENYLEGVGKDE